MTGGDGACTLADSDCNDLYDGIQQAADFDVYDVRAPSADPNPPETYLAYLNDTTVQRRIGAKAQFQECADAPSNKFQSTGDDARSFQKVLEKVVGSGIQVLIWAGYICPLLSLFRPRALSIEESS